MTHADLDARARDQAISFGAWVLKASDRIARAFDDAQAHATRAITETLKRTPDGRPTVRKAARSPSATAALSRLDELWTWLAGPSVTSLDGLIRDAREAFYRESFAAWKPFIPEELWASPDPSPTRADVRAVRGAVLHGMDVRTEIGRSIETARNSLPAGLAMAGSRAATGRDSASILATWRERNERAVTLAVRVALSDGQMDADVRAGRDLVHPDHLDERPVTVGR